MLKKGTVSSVNNEKGTVILWFSDWEMESEELTVFQKRTFGQKDYSMPIVGEEGWCILEANSYDGLYLGGGYTEDNLPPKGAGKGINIKEYPDGTVIKYDSNSHKMSIEAAGDIELHINGSLNGYIKNNIEIVATEIVTEANFLHTGVLTVSGIIKSLKDLIAGKLSMLSHKHKDAENRDTSGPQ